MSAKYDRQIDIINFLLKSKRITYSKLAYEFNVSIHTIKRDISELSYHFPIVTFQGKYGGVEINNCFVVNNSFMKSEYVKLIIDGLHMLLDSTDDVEIKSLLDIIDPKSQNA